MDATGGRSPQGSPRAPRLGSPKNFAHQIGLRLSGPAQHTNQQQAPNRGQRSRFKNQTEYEKQRPFYIKGIVPLSKQNEEQPDPSFEGQDPRQADQAP